MNDNLIPVDQALYESLKWFVRTNSCTGPETDRQFALAYSAMIRYEREKSKDSESGTVYRTLANRSPVDT